MKIVTNKFVITVLTINILYIIIGYFGILDTTGYLDSINKYDGIIEGTPSEYWRVELSYYYSITYLMIPVLNFITIVLYKGFNYTNKKIESVLKIQIIAFLMINIILNISNLKLETYYTPLNLDLNNIVKNGALKYYDILIVIASIVFVMRKDIKNVKLIGILLFISLTILGLTKIHSNIHQANMINKVIDAQSRYVQNGTPLVKLKPNIFSIEIIDDGFTSFERSTNNYTNITYMVAYLITNKPSNKEIFELVDKVYINYYPKDNSYIKEKSAYTSTALYKYNMINEFRENDLYLINIYKRKGLDEAMKELTNLDENKKKGLIVIFMKTVNDNKKNSQ